MGRRFYERDRLAEKGETIVVTRDGKAIADLVKHRKEPDQINKSSHEGCRSSTPATSISASPSRAEPLASLLGICAGPLDAGESLDVLAYDQRGLGIEAGPLFMTDYRTMRRVRTVG